LCRWCWGGSGSGSLLITGSCSDSCISTGINTRRGRIRLVNTRHTHNLCDSSIEIVDDNNSHVDALAIIKYDLIVGEISADLNNRTGCRQHGYVLGQQISGYQLDVSIVLDLRRSQADEVGRT